VDAYKHSNLFNKKYNHFPIIVKDAGGLTTSKRAFTRAEKVYKEKTGDALWRPGSGKKQKRKQLVTRKAGLMSMAH